MSERGMTTDEPRDFEVEVDDSHQEHDAALSAGPAGDPDAVVALDDSLASASGVEPAGRQRRLRTRPRATDGRRAADFDPTSRGDENGEVM